MESIVLHLNPNRMNILIFPMTQQLMIVNFFQDHVKKTVEDGIYRISSITGENRVLTPFNSTEIVGEVKVQQWSDDLNQQQIRLMTYE